MAEVVLAVDVGGTKTAAALAGRDDIPLATRVAPSRAADGPDAVIATITDLATSLLDAADAETGERTVLSGVGIGTAGVVDARAGTIVSSTDTFADWPGTDVSARVHARLADRLIEGAVVAVQNDVDAHAAGEYRHGAAAGASSALIVAVGTGIGAGVIVDGRPLRGAHHVGGELAHLPIRGADHLRCPCGRIGHLEAIGAGIGLHWHYLSLGGDPAVSDSRAVAAAATAGDERARQAIADSAAAVGRALAGAASLLDPERIVVTGGVPRIGEAWWDPMLAAYRAEAIDALQTTPILPGALGDDAPLRGAAASAWRN
ncbi:ROK family protein [Microbacterium esteraromaticum]|uniref:ROK family protein n=1 Tax=Microbacterium esteraromaticum TaxID=57043 RepID=A0A939IU11_9MICO|nr:ROK family protein [Microbacterium esteraromaticum]MBN8204936.1 ROK family protein [Microbacterium esteraromaticum]MBN8415090.1 ROK family protein [Microbacterium esteraromaticum]